jgi:hypothetical protein
MHHDHHRHTTYHHTPRLLTSSVDGDTKPEADEAPTEQPHATIDVGDRGVSVGDRGVSPTMLVIVVGVCCWLSCVNYFDGCRWWARYEPAVCAMVDCLAVDLGGVLVAPLSRRESAGRPFAARNW